MLVFEVRNIVHPPPVMHAGYLWPPHLNIAYITYVVLRVVELVALAGGSIFIVLMLVDRGGDRG